ncbi:ComEC/Rec2 family competence protein [Brevibacillus choshinensis]|uniref:MBL fold metallo-hydrolase n=1 Tax=Brevibacillus choshinensis TaxID=54911 RepID=A0ABX7FUM6_BRECH|nr:MBL fold metallo-hydrolase [Brevibacillus choshinensis]QRG69949.1 MBL fold metallo-hydrolase [Brevibacillus choshinensis]
MGWKTKWQWLLLGICAAFLLAYSLDHRSQTAVKVEDPYASESEQDFLGLVMTYFALPHGESTLVRLPGGKTMLIDTGSAEDWPVLFERLSERKLTRLDFVVITNDQPEYAGGYAQLTSQFLVDTVVVPKLMEQTIMRAIPLRPSQKRIAVANQGEWKLGDEVSMQVLLPEEPLFLSPQNNSLVFRLQHGKLRFLFTSGINEKAEERLLERHADQLNAEVLQVGDQGSNQGSSQPFLTQVDPQVAIIQTGKLRDDRRESHSEVLERLGESWAETYMTSHDGSITILSNGKDYRILKQKK